MKKLVWEGGNRSKKIKDLTVKNFFTSKNQQLKFLKLKNANLNIKKLTCVQFCTLIK